MFSSKNRRCVAERSRTNSSSCADKGRIAQVGHLSASTPRRATSRDHPAQCSSKWHRMSVFTPVARCRRGTDLMIHDLDIVLSFVKSRWKKCAPSDSRSFLARPTREREH